MRAIFFFAVLGLLTVEALLLPRAVRDGKTTQKMRTETAAEVGLPATLSPFAGLDAAGRPMTLVSEETRWVLPIVIHSSRMASDLDYLGRLRKTIPDRAFVFVGVCDTSRCGDGPSSPALPGIPLVAYGSYAPLAEIARFDDH